MPSKKKKANLLELKLRFLELDVEIDNLIDTTEDIKRDIQRKTDEKWEIYNLINKIENKFQKNNI